MEHETNLTTPLTELVDRERELRELTRMLSSARLVTITGTGGAGKTRLAIAVGWAALDSFPYGVWFVDLSSAASDELEHSIATSLGLRMERDQPALASLAAALKHRGMLLVLDNCEHLIGACVRLASALLGICPRLRILATSREPLRLTGEVIWRLDPLPVPSGNDSSLEAISRSAAVELFANR